jgi:hypothetical protein
MVPAGATATSFWVNARIVLGRTLRRSTMPIAWCVTLLICAGSAFAVRDVLFPSLGEAAPRSLWEPRPTATSEPSPIRSTTSAERPAAAAPADVVIEPTTSADAVDSSAPRAPAGSETWRGVDEPPSDSPWITPPSSTPTVSTIDDGHGTATTVASQRPPTTTTDASVSTTDSAQDTTTTDAATGDTITDQSGRRGTGPGGGGGSDDNTP